MAKRVLVKGECLHMHSSICSEGFYQNYLCPYRFSDKKCSYFIAITEEMVQSWETKGCVLLTREQVPYDPMERVEKLYCQVRKGI